MKIKATLFTLSVISLFLMTACGTENSIRRTTNAVNNAVHDTARNNHHVNVHEEFYNRNGNRLRNRIVHSAEEMNGNRLRNDVNTGLRDNSAYSGGHFYDNSSIVATEDPLRRVNNDMAGIVSDDALMPLVPNDTINPILDNNINLPNNESVNNEAAVHTTRTNPATTRTTAGTRTQTTNTRTNATPTTATITRPLNTTGTNT